MAQEMFRPEADQPGTGVEGDRGPNERGGKRSSRRIIWLACGVVVAWITNLLRWAVGGRSGASGLVLSGLIAVTVLVGCAAATWHARRRSRRDPVGRTTAQPRT